MGAYDIQGKNCVFQLKIGDDYFTVVCAKSFTFNPITDMKETTTVGSGFWKEFRPRKLSYTISFNGMHQVESLASQEKIKTMFDYQIGFIPLPYRMIYTDNSSNIMAVEGWVYVTSTLLDASPVNLVNGTVEMQGNGPITVSDVLPDLINLNISSLGDSFISAVFQFKLFDANGAVIFDSGMLPGASGGNLTHPVNVTAQVQKGTYSVFWQALSQSLGNAYQLDAPPTDTAIFNDLLTNNSSFGVQDYDFTSDRNVVFTLGTPNPPPTCVAPSLSTQSSPGGTVGTYWISTIVVSGSQPFSISNVTKPAWINISISGSIITMEGTPEAGFNQNVNFDVSNACGSVTFDDNVDIEENPDAIVLNWAYSETGSPPSSTSCTFRMFINGTQVILSPSPGSGSIFANAGDVIQCDVVGPGTMIGPSSPPNKHLDVQDSVDGEIYNHDTTGTIVTFTFTATLGHNYDITGIAGS